MQPQQPWPAQPPTWTPPQPPPPPKANTGLHLAIFWLLVLNLLLTLYLARVVWGLQHPFG